MDSWSQQKLPFSKKRLSKTVILSYIFDYLIIVILIITFYALDSVEPHHQEFSLENYTLHYKYAVKERIPVFDLCIIAVLAPAIIIAFYTLVIDGIFSHNKTQAVSSGRRKLLGKYRMKDRLWELNCGVLGLMLSVGAAFTITGSLKNAVGKPRPDLIDRCQPKIDHDPTPLTLANHSICTQTDNAILKDGFRSFPSGHSSTAFGGLYYLSIYLAGKLHVLDSKGEVWKSFIVMVPTLGAALVAASRIMDARHHPFDVLSGSLLGILTAWGSYRQYFPPVTETWRKGRAYPIRSWGKEPEIPPEAYPINHEGREPLRREDSLKTIDEEQPMRNGEAGATSTADVGESGTNVFRQQISNSQRHRQLATQAYGDARPTPSSVYTADLNRTPTTTTYNSQLPSSNPYAPTYAARRRRGDNYSSSSSEDEPDEFELQRTYTLSNPHAGHAAAPVAYNPVNDTFGAADTAYHAQTRGFPTPSDEADLGAGVTRSPPPPHVPPHTAGFGSGRGADY
ncbi:Phosphatidic acid phosphatase type 2/haloperoxidase [Macrophomina phaseolina MS6]|uniref:Phosphatidic acid phosphatase type 2/haloperoxidase n=1 Tax=Macrophomina phaseolina (strain MS6) TaxID=1126212 RepID=K2RA84_MACPH|nr:Phosphatidic acid phosphatase type 2/haloperoxidase [Macrophomina phaseolina MS6]